MSLNALQKKLLFQFNYIETAVRLSVIRKDYINVSKLQIIDLLLTFFIFFLK